MEYRVISVHFCTSRYSISSLLYCIPSFRLIDSGASFFQLSVDQFQLIMRSDINTLSFGDCSLEPVVRY